MFTFATNAFEVQGHRGARGLYPENSLPSFAAAIAAGADALELDVLVTKEGALVIHHNFWVNPDICQYLDGTPIFKTPLILHTPLSEIKKFDCGAKRNHRFLTQTLIPGTRIPLLSELFEMILNSDDPFAQSIRLNLEIKVEPTNHALTISPELFAKKITAEVAAYGFENRVYYSSFDLSVLKEIRKLDPNAILGFIFEERTLLQACNVNPHYWLGFVLQAAKEIKAEIVSPDYGLLSVEAIEALHHSGFRVIPWTVNFPEDCAKLMEMGVDGVISDYPSEIISLVNVVK